MQDNNTKRVTRLEIIDHTECDICGGNGVFGLDECRNCAGIGSPGRSVVFWDKDKKIELSLQDNDRTLKIFISDRDE